jgi:pimeloyl-ACP methyl ester carboxylesterase
MALWAMDGTQCTREETSNVLKFAQRYRGLKSYWSGPGTWDQSLGLTGSGNIFGTGAKRIVRGVVAQIHEFRARDHDMPIDLVGFSRGAAIANEVAALLHEQGCSCEEKCGGKPRSIPVRFLGLFDPVHSMGMPTFGQGGMPIFLGNRRWHAKSISPNVKRSAIAYADDERDAFFLPSYLAPPTADRQAYRAHNFDGVHGDVGGTRKKNANLGKISLAWIVRRAVEAGVKINTAGLVNEQWIENAKDLGLLMPHSGKQATGKRGWARTF